MIRRSLLGVAAGAHLGGVMNAPWSKLLCLSLVTARDGLQFSFALQQVLVPAVAVTCRQRTPASASSV